MTPRRALLAGAVLVVVLAAVLGARASHDANGQTTAQAAARQSPAPTSASVAAAAPVTADCAQAGGDAASALTALTGPGALDPRTRPGVLQRWVLPGFRAELDARLAVSQAAEDQTGLLAGLSVGAGVTTVVAPVAVAVEDCGSGVATARLWTVALLATGRTGRLDGSFSTETLRLSATGAGWLVRGWATSTGPVPVLSQPATPIEEALAVTAGMHAIGAPRLSAAGIDALTEVGVGHGN